MIELLVGAAVLMCLMGQSCGIRIPDDIPIDDDLPLDADVSLEMVNKTNFEVDPGIYVDPVEGVFSSAELVTDENFLVIDPPLAPGETVTALYVCPDIGTVVSDYAYFYVGEDVFLSEDRPILVRNEDFICGDVIRFIFDEDATGEFRTDVEILGPALD
jgi:hypothetical protein